MALAPLEIAFAEEAAGADRNLGLGDVVARAERIVLRVEEDQDAFALIFVHQ